MYSLPVEKSRLVTWPSGVPDVGQLENAVSEGRWICRIRYPVSNFGEVIEDVSRRTIRI